MLFLCEVLVNAEMVALRILEPGRLFCSQDAYVINRLQTWKIIVLRDGPGKFEFGDTCGDVGNPEALR